MGIDASKSTTIFDLGWSARLKLKSMCESSRFPYLVAGAAFAGLAMIISSVALSAASFGIAAPLLSISLIVGAVLLSGAVIAGLCFGLNKLLPEPEPSVPPRPAF